MDDRIVINEVGLRDGLQNQARKVSTEEKLSIFSALAKAGLRNLEATSFVSPKSVPQLADADELFRQLPDDPLFHLTALVPNMRGYERARAAGAKGVAVVLSATETLNRKNINMSLQQATAVSAEVVARARAEGVFARAYIAAGFACPYEGLTPPAVVLDLAEKMSRAGADELAIADTIGAGNPKQVGELLRPLMRGFGVSRVAVHFHDTRGLGSALAWAALEVGVRRFDSSIGGLGGCPFAPGASGNVATEDLVFLFEDAGMLTGVDFDALFQAVELVQRIVGGAPGGRILPWYRSVKASRGTDSSAATALGA